MSNYEFQVNNPSFIFHFSKSEEIQLMMDEEPQQVIGYMVAIGEFCRVINERARSDLSLEDLQKELLGLVDEGGKLTDRVNGMFP